MSHVTIDDIRRSISNTDNDAADIKKKLRELKRVRRELVRILSHKVDQFESINALDEAHRLDVMRGHDVHNAAHDVNVKELYRDWLNSCQQFIPDVELLRKKRFATSKVSTVLGMRR